MRGRLQELLQFPNDWQVRRMLSFYMPSDVAWLVVAYAHHTTLELVDMHLAQTSGQCLTLAECLELLNLVDTPMWLAYIGKMFEEVPPLHKWPFLLRRRARQHILPPRRVDYYRDWDMQGRVQALQSKHACCENCRVTRDELTALLADAETLVRVLPAPGLTVKQRFQMACRAELWVGWGVFCIQIQQL
jgi:hypothetical protein